MKTLLIIDYATNWFEVFGPKPTLASGETVKIDQVEWKDLSLKASSGGGLTVHCRHADNPLPFSPQKEDRVHQHLDFLLVRNFPTGLRGVSYRNMLIGMQFAGVPSVNSISSILMDLDRPLSHLELRKAQSALQHNNTNITVVDMQYYPNMGELVSTTSIPSSSSDQQQQFPAVVKVGATHAGYGKCRVADQAELDDCTSVLATTGTTFFTVEPFLDVEYEYRIQRIGTQHTRCFMRLSSTSWKNNWGDIQFKDMPVEPRHIQWADECQKMFGGLDIFALDVLKLKNSDKETIIEINCTANGLMWQHEKEDNRLISSLVLSKMSSLFQ